MNLTIFFTTLILFSYGYFTNAEIEEVIVVPEHDRNLYGSASNQIIAIFNETNNIYFTVTGVAATYSTYNILNFTNTQGDALPKDILKLTMSDQSILLRVTLTNLSPEAFDKSLLLTVNETVAYTFVLKNPTDIVITSCLNDEVILRIPDSKNGYIMSMLGQENNPTCSFTISLDDTKKIKLDMSVCGIQYEQEFRLSFRQYQNFEGVTHDAFLGFKCRRKESIFQITTVDEFSGSYESVKDGDEHIFEQDIHAIMYLHKTGEPHTALTSDVTVREPVTLRIEMDNLYRNNFDMIPLQCTANNVPIIVNGCATPPMGHFIREAVGIFNANFNMFRTVTNGISDDTVVFSCIMYVCLLGNCPIVPCQQ